MGFYRHSCQSDRVYCSNDFSKFKFAMHHARRFLAALGSHELPHLIATTGHMRPSSIYKSPKTGKLNSSNVRPTFTVANTSDSHAQGVFHFCLSQLTSPVHLFERKLTTSRRSRTRPAGLARSKKNGLHAKYLERNTKYSQCKTRLVYAAF
jgi:hypothetical protein